MTSVQFLAFVLIIHIFNTIYIVLYGLMVVPEVSGNLSWF